MRGTMTSFFKVWEIEDQENYAVVRMSTSRKLKEDSQYDKQLEVDGVAKNGYVSSPWSYVRFVGKAYNKLMKDIESGDTITNLEMSIEREPYFDNKEKQMVYPKNIKMTVFSFELPDSTGDGTPAKAPKNIDRAPRVSNDEEKSTQESKNEYYPDVEDDEEPF